MRRGKLTGSSPTLLRFFVLFFLSLSSPAASFYHHKHILFSSIQLLLHSSELEARGYYIITINYIFFRSTEQKRAEQHSSERGISGLESCFLYSILFSFEAECRSERTDRKRQDLIPPLITLLSIAYCPIFLLRTSIPARMHSEDHLVNHTRISNIYSILFYIPWREGPSAPSILSACSIYVSNISIRQPQAIHGCLPRPSYHRRRDCQRFGQSKTVTAMMQGTCLR